MAVLFCRQQPKILYFFRESLASYIGVRCIIEAED